MSAAAPGHAGARAALVAALGFVLIAAVAGGVALGAPRSRSPTLVVLFTPPNTDPLVARIEAELAAVHIAVRILDIPPESELDAVVTQEIASGASAAIRVLPHSSGTQVWTNDTTAQVLRRRSIGGADTSDAATAVVALRTVEFLRASLLNLRRRSTSGGALGAGQANGPTANGQANGQANGNTGTLSGAAGLGLSTDTPASAAPASSSPASVGAAAGAAAAASDSTSAAAPARAAPARAATPARVAVAEPAPPVVAREPRPAAAEPAPARQTRAREDDNAAEPAPTIRSPAAGGASRPFDANRFAVTFGPARLANSGGVSGLTSAVVTGRAQVAGPLGVEIMALFPFGSSRLTRPEGASDVSVALFGAAAGYRVRVPRPWLTDGALGAAAVMSRVAGVPSSQVQSSTQTDWNGAVQARAGAGVEIVSWLAARVDVLGGVTMHRLVVAYSDANNVSHDVAAWGRGYVAASLGLQAGW